MKRIMTLCEPYWTGSTYHGYWSIKAIYEYTPNFIEKLLGRKPYSTEHTYTKLGDYASPVGWCDSQGNQLDYVSIFSRSPGDILCDHLRKHITAKKMEKIQKNVIKETP